MLRSSDWSLCVGAGLNRGLLPDWRELTVRILNTCGGWKLNPSDFEKLNKYAWGYDAWLQTALNVMLKDGKQLEDYYTLLENEIYGDLLKKAENCNLKTELIKALSEPTHIKKNDAVTLLRFLEPLCQKTSLFAVAKWMQRLADLDQAPRSVLTLNADGLLDTLLKMLDLQSHFTNPAEKPPDRFFRALRSSDRIGRRIPIYYLHGCLVPQLHGKRARRESRNNLIFPESTYGQLSSKVFTWQQTIFLGQAQAQRVLFIGLSMSDPNIRRWLSWCNSSALEDHRVLKAHFSNPSKPSKKNAERDYFLGRHIWIAEKPTDKVFADAMEYSLAHLGTRICWVQKWDELPDVLENLLPTIGSP